MAIRPSVDGDPRRIGPGVEAGIHSRVVSCDVNLQSLGVLAYAYTPPVGQRCWLLGVRLWFFPEDETPIGSVNFRILTGTTAVNSPAEILTWEDVLPKLNWNQDLTPWVRHDMSGHREWTMNTLYQGAGRRFGVYAYRTGAWSSWMWASFEVAEG